LNPSTSQDRVMVRSILAAALLISLVVLTSAGGGYKKKLFMKYAMTNMFVKCVGQQAMDKYMLEYIKACKKCYNREFDPQLKPVYIKPYPVEDNKISNRLSYHTHPQQYVNQPFQQYQQPPYPQQQQQFQQYQQQPQYQQQQQQQQYRQQPQYGYQQQQPQVFYGPGFGFQPYPNSQVNNQVLNRKTRQANKKNNKVQGVPKDVVAETNVAGEAELYYYNKLKNYMQNKVGNFSCVMHEMGYFTEDNEVDLVKYKKAYTDLTLPDAMKEDFIDNIDTCHEVSQCLPDKCFAKYPYGKEYGRQFFFVMCEKKKAMEVCLKKQMIDDYYKYKDLLADEDIPDDMSEDVMNFFSM